MKRRLTIDDILYSVEFELLQGTLPQEDLSRGIRDLRAYQNKARADLFGQAKRAPTQEEIIDLELRLNEMMLTLIEVLGQQVAGLHETFTRAEHLLPPPRAFDKFDNDQEDQYPTPADDSDTRPNHPSATTQAAVTDAETGQSYSAPSSSTASMRAPGAGLAPVAETPLSQALKPDSLTQDMEVRPVRVPLVGGILTRVRLFFHSLVLFYVNRLADRQAEVNLQLAHENMNLQRSLNAQTAELRRLHATLQKLIEEQAVSTGNQSTHEQPQDEKS